MNIKIEINTDGAAFEDYGTGSELNNILNQWLSGFEFGYSENDKRQLYDTNGNRCGTVTITKE